MVARARLSDELLRRADWRITKIHGKHYKEYTPKQLHDAGLLTVRPNGLTPIFYNILLLYLF